MGDTGRTWLHPAASLGVHRGRRSRSSGPSAPRVEEDDADDQSPGASADHQGHLTASLVPLRTAPVRSRDLGVLGIGCPSGRLGFLTGEVGLTDTASPTSHRGSRLFPLLPDVLRRSAQSGPPYGGPDVGPRCLSTAQYWRFLWSPPPIAAVQLRHEHHPIRPIPAEARVHRRHPSARRASGWPQHRGVPAVLCVRHP